MKSFDDKAPLYGEKIVFAKQMAVFEKEQISKDPSLAERFMDNAALGLFKILEQKVLDSRQVDRVVLLIGKGNNGADAFALGAYLVQVGFLVEAFALFKETNPLSEKKAQVFQSHGGRVHLLESIKDFVLSDNCLVIDGLLGTGFTGKTSGILSEVIEAVNHHNCFVFSIDIPSGVDGNTGMVGGSAIYADMTAYLGVLKIGHLFEKGLEHCGLLHYVDFGLNCTSLSSNCYLFNSNCLHYNLPKRSRLCNKYDVGQVIAVCGNTHMKGAAELCCAAAYRAGCGLVRHFYLGDGAVSMKEVITLKMTPQAFEQELYRTKAIVIGPGLGRDQEAKDIVTYVTQIPNIPIVIDGDALFLLEKPPKYAILTPHKGELLRLLGIVKETKDADILKAAQSYADKYQVIIIYKGVPTVILSPKKDMIVIVSGNPGMSSGGTGDVLAGIVTSFLAQGSEAIDAATLGVTVHGKAADFAAMHLSERYMLASDIIHYLSEVFLE